MLLYLLLVVAVSRARRPLAGAHRGGRRESSSSTGSSCPRSTRSRSASSEHLLALAVFLTVAAAMSGFVSLAARRAVEGQRARAEAETLARLAGSAPAATTLDTLVARARPPGGGRPPPNGRRLADRCGRRRPTSRETRTSPRSRSTSTGTTSSRSPDAPLRSENQRVLDAFARELAASVAHRRAAGGGSGGGSALSRERAAHGAPRRGLARPADAARRRSRPPSPASSSATSRGRPTRATSSSPRSTRRPTGSTRSSAISST